MFINPKDKVNYDPKNPEKCVPTSEMVCEYCDPKIARECPNRISRDTEDLFKRK